MRSDQAVYIELETVSLCLFWLLRLLRFLWFPTTAVKVRVDATHGAIRIGDLLVTSDERGTAMLSIPIMVNGMKLHRPATLIGKALEPLPAGKGQILVLLSLQ